VRYVPFVVPPTIPFSERKEKWEEREEGRKEEAARFYVQAYLGVWGVIVGVSGSYESEWIIEKRLRERVAGREWSML
jgi:hypothetical protein